MLKSQFGCLPAFPQPRVMLSGAVSGLTDVSGILIHYLANGREGTTRTNTYGWYQIHVPLHADVIIYPERVDGYIRDPRVIKLERVETDRAALNFTYRPVTNGMQDTDFDGFQARSATL